MLIVAKPSVIDNYYVYDVVQLAKSREQKVCIKSTVVFKTEQQQVYQGTELFVMDTKITAIYLASQIISIARGILSYCYTKIFIDIGVWQLPI